MNTLTLNWRRFVRRRTLELDYRARDMREIEGYPEIGCEAVVDDLAAMADNADFTLNIEAVGNYLMVQPVGALDGTSADIFMEETETACIQFDGAVVLDMEKVPVIDNRGVSAVVHLQKRLTDRHRAFAVACCQDAVREYLAFTRHDVVIPIFQSIKEIQLAATRGGRRHSNHSSTI